MGGYEIYLGELLLPVPPQKLQMKIGSKNKTVTLINESEVNLLKEAALTEVSFDALLPQAAYPFARYAGGFQRAEAFLDALEKLKTGKKPFQFIVSRSLPGGERLFGTNLKVSLEDYQITEDAKEGFDVKVSVKLKQYRDFGAKTLQAVSAAGAAPVMTVAQARPAESAPAPKTYTVQKGDSLWNIAKKCLGDGERYREIYELNRDKVSNPNLIRAGQVLTLP